MLESLIPPEQGERTVLIRYASVGLVPVRSAQVMATLSYLSPPFSPESPKAIPGKMGVSGGRQFGSCHLYSRPGQARRKIL